MTYPTLLSVVATGAPGAAGAALAWALTGRHRADSLTTAPQPRGRRGRAGAHRRRVRTGETAVCPEPNGSSNPAHVLRRPVDPGAHRLIAWTRAHVDLSAWLWLQRDLIPAHVTGATYRV